MKNLRFIFNTLWALVLLAAITFIIGCGNDDEGPVDFDIVEMMAGDSDLNAATSPTDVPADANITVVFSSAVDAATATEDNFMLMRDYDDTEVPVAVSADGNTVTVTPQEDLGTGTLYIFTIGTGVESTDGQMLDAEVERNFTTAGTFAPAGLVAHWDFEGDSEDATGNFTVEEEVDVEYVDSRNDGAGQAAQFNGATSVIEVPNGSDLLTSQFTVSLWIYLSTVNNTTGNFVMGIGNFHGLQLEIPADAAWLKFAGAYELEDGTITTNDFFFNADGVTNATIAADEAGIDNATIVDKDLSGSGGLASVLQDKWTHLTYTFDGESKIRSLYLNGELVFQQDLSLLTDDNIAEGLQPFGTAASLTFQEAAEGDYDDKLTFGWWQSTESTFANAWGDWAVFGNASANQFVGMLDDVRFFNVALTGQEVDLMYESEN